MARLVLVLFALIALGCGPGRAGPDERRVALVVGVGAYRNAPHLPNTANDARAVAASLRRLGFVVELLLDPDRLALEGGVRRLGQQAQNVDAALFFYAGHAIEAAGRNWLLPVSAELKDTRNLRFEALDIESVVEQTEGQARVTLVFLDSCRDNPFRKRFGAGTRAVPASGLGQVSAAAGTLIAFSTAPGTVAADGKGPNSPFTTALLRYLETPGLEIRQLLANVRREVREETRGRQVPWENSALEGEFFFRAAAAAAAAAAAPAAKASPRAGAAPAPASAAAPLASAASAAAAAPAAGAVELDALFWRSIQDTRDAADLDAYLGRFPNGVFAGLARNRLAKLKVEAAAQREPAKGEPTKVEPAKGEPARSEPAKAEPAKAEPARSEPARSEPAKADSAKVEQPDSLRRRFDLLLPSIAAERREARARDYAAAAAHKAQAVALRGASTWRATERASAAEAEDAVLEGCQVVYDEPCALLAVDDTLLPAPGERNWPRRDMARVRYAGPFDPAQVPAVTALTRQRPDVAQYRAASGAKAIALHGWGRVFVATGSPSQAAAESAALAACNADPNRKGADGPCYLYASGNDVVLPRRLLAAHPAEPAAAIAAVKPAAPLSPAPASPAPVPPAPVSPVAVAAPAAAPAAAPPALAAAPPIAAPASAPPGLTEVLAKAGYHGSAAETFAQRKGPKALAFHVESARWYMRGPAPSLPAAEAMALEGCQLRFGTPCVLVAANEALLTADPRTAPRRDMPNVRYDGPFNIERVPMAGEREAQALRDYAAAPEPKALALHSNGRLRWASGSDAAEAEAKALAACQDPDSGYPCFVYAVNSRVVLAQRRTEAAR